MITHLIHHRGAIAYWAAVVILATATAWTAVAVIDLQRRADIAAHTSQTRDQAITTLTNDVQKLREHIAHIDNDTTCTDHRSRP